MLPGQNANSQALEVFLNEEDEVKDSEIVEEILNGHPEQFNCLVIKYESRLQRLALRFVSDHSEAKDIVQEAFIRAFQGLSRFRGESSFFTWIYRITINTAKNYVNIKDRKMIVKCGFTADEFDMLQDRDELDADENPEHELHLTEVKETVMHIIDDMPEDLKVTLTLREVSGMSYQDIAQVLHCPVGTIRSRLHRARLLITQQLDGPNK